MNVYHRFCHVGGTASSSLCAAFIRVAAHPTSTTLCADHSLQHSAISVREHNPTTRQQVSKRWCAPLRHCHQAIQRAARLPPAAILRQGEHARAPAAAFAAEHPRRLRRARLDPHCRPTLRQRGVAEVFLERLEGVARLPAGHAASRASDATVIVCRPSVRCAERRRFAKRRVSRTSGHQRGAYCFPKSRYRSSTLVKRASCPRAVALNSDILPRTAVRSGQSKRAARPDVMR